MRVQAWFVPRVSDIIQSRLISLTARIRGDRVWLVKIQTRIVFGLTVVLLSADFNVYITYRARKIQHSE